MSRAGLRQSIPRIAPILVVVAVWIVSTRSVLADPLSADVTDLHVIVMLGSGLGCATLGAWLLLRSSAPLDVPARRSGSLERVVGAAALFPALLAFYVLYELMRKPIV